MKQLETRCGVLVPRSAFRPMIVPRPKEESVAPPANHRDGVRASAESKANPEGENKAQEKRGRMRIMTVIDSPEAIAKILACLGLPILPPPVAPAQPDPESLSF